MLKRISSYLSKELSRVTWLVIGAFVAAILLEIGGLYGMIWYFGDVVADWVGPGIFTVIATFVLGLVVVGILELHCNRLKKTVLKIVEQESHELRTAYHRARALQSMASTLRATLSFDRVVEAAMDVCGLALEEAGIPARSLRGVVFLYEENELMPVTTRSFLVHDMRRRVRGESGIIGKSLEKAEPVITDSPSEDAELSQFNTFSNCRTAVAIPLRAGYQFYGAMVIGTEEPIHFSPEHVALFASVGDHAVIALQNARLYQELRAEKDHLIVADENARKELARDLHDGPTQSVAAIAMRVNFIRSLIRRDPELALKELTKVEEMARDTSRNIRGMLFTLRPLLLETEGLAAAIENVMNRHKELAANTKMKLVGAEYAGLLNEKAQSVVFSILEEALGNARKYSRASLVEVRLWQEQDLFVAQVTDNGVGFDVQQVNANYSSRGSLGLVNMRERAERIDGSIRIESAPKQGAAVTLVVPLERHGKVSRNGHSV